MDSSALGPDAGLSDQLVTIAAHIHAHGRTLTDTQAQAGRGVAQHGDPRTWLRDEEATVRPCLVDDHR